MGEEEGGSVGGRGGGWEWRVGEEECGSVGGRGGGWECWWERRRMGVLVGEEEGGSVGEKRIYSTAVVTWCNSDRKEPA